MPTWKTVLWSALVASAWCWGVVATEQPLLAQSAPAAPRSNESSVPVTAHRVDLELVEKFAKILETKARIARVDGFDPVIINVQAMRPNAIRVQGLLQGVTTLVITDENDQSFTIEVFVKGDARTLQAIIDRKFPNSSIEAFKVQDAVALRGWVTHPEQITQIVEIAEQFYPKVLNQMRVGGIQQVLLKVKVMEAQRSVIRELGMNWTYTNRNAFVNSSPGKITSLGAVALGIPVSATNSAATLQNATASYGIVGDHNSFSNFLTAMREESLLKILAEPEVVATNGRPATLLSGGEFPIVVPGSLGTVAIQFKEFGVRLEAVAIVLGGGSLRLELQPEVSERDLANSITVSGFTVPALTVRRVNTQVEMKFGQTLMLAGLISRRQSANNTKIPFFGELPYIGPAFSRKNYNEAETEVVITVTPELVSPLDDNQVPPGGPGGFTDTPTDREFMVYGLNEVPKYGERCPDCAPGSAGPYIVPGLKTFDQSVPSNVMPSVPASAPPPADDGPTLPPPGDSQSARSRSRSNTVQRRPTGSGIRQTGFNEAASETKRDDPRRTQQPLKAPSATGASRSAPAGAQNNSKKSTNKSASKPGLIEPKSR